MFAGLLLTLFPNGRRLQPVNVPIGGEIKGTAALALAAEEENEGAEEEEGDIEERVVEVVEVREEGKEEVTEEDETGGKKSGLEERTARFRKA